MKFILSFSLALIMSWSATAKVIEKIVAIVNNEIITLTDIQDYRNKLKTGGLIDESLLRLVENPKTLVSNNELLINHIIDERILDSEVAAKGLNVKIEKVEQEIRSITKKNGITRAQLKQALKQKGVVFSDYQDFIKTTLERQALIERAISSKIKISNDDINAYYMSQQSDGQSGKVFAYKIAHILFLPKNGGVEEARARAEIVLDKLSRNQSFEKLASQYSEDPGFSQGGLLGTFKPGEMLKPIEEAVIKLPESEVSGILRSDVGFHIVKLLRKELITDPKLEKEKSKIQSLLFAQEFKKQFRSWLNNKRKEAFIKIN